MNELSIRRLSMNTRISFVFTNSIRFNLADEYAETRGSESAIVFHRGPRMRPIDRQAIFPIAINDTA